MALKIDRARFAQIMAYIAAGVQKPITDAGIEVYYDLLGDLPESALKVAAQRAVLEHHYATFPPVAMIRGFALETTRGEVKALTGPEAWGIALKVIGKFDVDYSADHKAQILAGMTPVVLAAVYEFGFMALYNLPSNAIETARAQFIKLYEAIAERERKTGILPAPVQAEIQAIGERNPAITAAANRAVAAIGVEQ